MTKFAVVEFIGENAVSVVPETWIETRDGVLHCYWPLINAQGYVKKAALPDKTNWSCFKIRVFCYSDTYKKAKRRAKLAEETSNLESSDEENRVGMKRKKNSPIYDDFLYEGDSEQDDWEIHGSLTVSEKNTTNPITTVTLPTAPVWSGSSCSNNGVLQVENTIPLVENAPHNSNVNFTDLLDISSRNVELLPTTYMGNSQPPLPNLQSPANAFASATRQDAIGCRNRAQDITPRSHRIFNQNHIPQPVSQVANTCSYEPNAIQERGILLNSASRNSTPKTCRTLTNQNPENQNYQKNILLNLQCILENQKEQLSLLRQLVSCSRAGSGDLILEDVLPQPVNTIEELQQLCEKLKQEAFYTNMVNYLAALSGYSIGESVRRMLSKIGTNRLWSMFSFKGRKTKSSFKDLVLSQVVLKACLKTHKKVSELEIELQIAETLKHAPNKPGGTRYQTREQQEAAKD